MNTKKTVALLTLVSILIACLFGCAETSDIGAEDKNIAIITKGSDSDFWDDMKSGALAAANEFNINVTVEGPESEEDYDTQNGMIENAVSRKVDVIILSAIDYEKNAPSVQNAIDSGVKVITVDSDVNVKGKELFIGTDNISAGEKAAKDNRVRYVSRNVFLDNEDKFDYVMRQLRQTEAIARKNGYAVAIGHPKEQTYNALKVWLPTLKSRNLRLVHLSEIVKALN